MGETFRQLGHLFAQSIPTVIFVFLLGVILDRLFFRPLDAVLKQREEETLGAFDRASELSAAADARSEAAIRWLAELDRLAGQSMATRKSRVKAVCLTALRLLPDP